MIKRKPDISDWINVLHGKVTEKNSQFDNIPKSLVPAFNVIVSIIAVLINVVILFEMTKQTNDSFNFSLILWGLFFLLMSVGLLNLSSAITLVYEKYSKKSRYNKTVKLLNDILKGRIKDTKEIRDKYFSIYSNKK